MRPDSVATLSSPFAAWRILDIAKGDAQGYCLLAGRYGTWQVVAPVNGSKADIRRRDGFDTRVITALLKNLTVVRCADSPESSY